MPIKELKILEDIDAAAFEQLNLYARLGLEDYIFSDHDTLKSVVKKNFKRAALLYHPDKNQKNKAKAEAIFKSVNEAHDILSDSAKRYTYDQTHSFKKTFASAPSSRTQNNFYQTDFSHSKPFTNTQPKPQPEKKPEFKFHFNMRNKSSDFVPPFSSANPQAEKKSDPKFNFNARSKSSDFFPSFSAPREDVKKTSYEEDIPSRPAGAIWTEAEWRRFSGTHKSMAERLMNLLANKKPIDSMSDRQWRALRLFNVLHFVLHTNECITLDDTEKLHPTLFEILSKANENNVKEWAEAFKKSEENVFLKLALNVPRVWWYKYPGVIITMAQGEPIKLFKSLSESELKLFDNESFRILFNRRIIDIHDTYKISDEKLQILYENEARLSPIKSADLSTLLKLNNSQFKYIIKSGVLLKLLHEERMDIEMIVALTNSDYAKHPSMLMSHFMEVGGIIFSNREDNSLPLDKLLLKVITNIIIENNDAPTYRRFQAKWSTLPCSAILVSVENTLYENTIFKHYFKLDANANFVINTECNFNSQLIQDLNFINQFHLFHLKQRLMQDLVRALLQSIKQINSIQDDEKNRMTVITEKLSELKASECSRQNLMDLIQCAEDFAGNHNVSDNECKLYYQIASLYPLVHECETKAKFEFKM